jgi:uncharacterized protein
VTAGAPTTFSRQRPAAWATALVRRYQRAAPAAIRARCRFVPTCSEYAVQTIERHGLARGGWRAMRRVARCRPPNGGIDEP